MNEKELIGKVHSTVYHQCQRRGYAAPVDVLMEVGVAQALVHHAPDAGVRSEKWIEVLFLLL